MINMAIKIKLQVTYISATLKTGKLIRQKSNISTTKPLKPLSIILPIAPDIRKIRPILSAEYLLSCLLASCMYTYTAHIRIAIVIISKNGILPEKLYQSVVDFLLL